MISWPSSSAADADYYTADLLADPSLPPIGIGPNCHIESAIVDKNARLGAEVVIRPFPLEAEMATDNWVIQDGIVVIPKDAVLPDGTRIEKE